MDRYTVLSREALDAIVDVCNPTLALMTCGMLYRGRSPGIGPAFSLDYSPHTATALGLAPLLPRDARKLAAGWSLSLLCYVLLMLYRRYHTTADIVTTALVVGGWAARLAVGLSLSLGP